MIHVSASYVTSNIENLNYNFTVGNFYDSISRYSVPLFVMLSCAFVLSNQKNKDFNIIYKKMLKDIIIPTMVWSLMYIFTKEQIKHLYLYMLKNGQMAHLIIIYGIYI